MTIWKLRDLWKETMRKLLLLDADVVIDLHTLGLPGPLDLKTVRQFCFEKADHY